MNTTNDLLDLSELEYMNTFKPNCELTIWDIENIEKEQLIRHIDKIISEKFEKKILEQNQIINELKKENDGIKKTINNLVFDLTNCYAFGTTGYQRYVNKYNENMLQVNQPLELEYIDYSFVSKELEKYYNHRVYSHTSKNASNIDIEQQIKKITLNIHQLENLDLADKIFTSSALYIIPPFFRQFIKNINLRREHFQYDQNNVLMIYITDYNQEIGIKELVIKNSRADMNINFIPTVTRSFVNRH